MLKTDLEKAFGAVVRSIKNHFALVPTDRFDFAPHPKTMPLERLVRHLQSIEYPPVRGILTDDWERPDLETDTDSHGAMIAALEANHVAAMQVLRDAGSEARLQEQITLPWGPKTTRLGGLLFVLDHMHHHRTQLFLYLKLLDVPVDSQTIWG